MSGSVFLSGGWSIGSGISGAVVNEAGRRASGAVSRGDSHGDSRRYGRRPRPLATDAGGVFTTLLALAGIGGPFQQVDYRNFRELLSLAISGRVRSWGRDTYLYDSRNRLIAIKRAARLDANGRCTPPRYFVRRPA